MAQWRAPRCGSSCSNGRASQHVAARPPPCAASSFPSSQLRQHGCRPSLAARVAGVDEASFEQEVLKADMPVLVDFWATWCGPCKLMDPLMVWLEQEYQGKLKVVKVEHDSNPSLIEKYKVYGLPAFLVFKDGAEVPGSKKEGAQNQEMLVSYLAEAGVTQ